MITGEIKLSRVDKKSSRDVCGIVSVFGIFRIGFLGAGNPIRMSCSRGVDRE